jgi:hypothetical protein
MLETSETEFFGDTTEFPNTPNSAQRTLLLSNPASFSFANSCHHLLSQFPELKKWWLLLLFGPLNMSLAPLTKHCLLLKKEQP